MSKKVLIICDFGKNRSQYLAEYLENKEYEVTTTSAKFDSDNINGLISNSDVVITVHPSVEENLKPFIDYQDKKVIHLDVEDRPEMVIGRKLDGDEWVQFQEQEVYPKLISQIEKYLPL